MRKIFLLFLLFLISNFSIGQVSAEEILEKYKVNTAFEPGEELVYNLKYGIISAGELKITVTMVPIGYDYYFHVVAKCYTTGLISKMARIYDVYESYFDLCTGLPIKSIRNVTENNYKRYNEDLFFQDSCVVYSMKSGRHVLPKNTLDIISAFYYSRRFIFDQKYKKNEFMNLTTWFNEKLYKIKMKYKTTEKVKTEFGKIECVKFVPVIEAGVSSLKHEDDMEAWFSNDGNYVPVKIRIDAPIANIHCELKSYKNLKNKDGLLK